LFELKYIKKGDATEEKIEGNCSEAVKQLQRYRFAKEFERKKITCWAVVFAGDKCVRRVAVEV
jgi:hypothetical protein